MDDKVLRGIMISLLHGGHYEILADLGALKVSEVNFYPSWLNMFNAFYLLVGQEGALGSSRELWVWYIPVEMGSQGTTVSPMILIGYIRHDILVYT